MTRCSVRWGRWIRMLATSGLLIPKNVAPVAKPAICPFSGICRKSASGCTLFTRPVRATAPAAPGTPSRSARERRCPGSGCRRAGAHPGRESPPARRSRCRRGVQVVVVGLAGDLVHRHRARVPGNDFPLVEAVRDSADVALPKPVLRAVLPEAPVGVDHEDAVPRGGVLLVEHDDASRDPGAVARIGGESGHPLDQAAPDQVAADGLLSVALAEHPVREDDRASAGALERGDEMEEECVVTVRCRGNAVSRSGETRHARDRGRSRGREPSPRQPRRMTTRRLPAGISGVRRAPPGRLRRTPRRSTSMVPRLLISPWSRARNFRRVGQSSARRRAAADSGGVASRNVRSWTKSAQLLAVVVASVAGRPTDPAVSGRGLADRGARRRIAGIPGQRLADQAFEAEFG